MSAIHKKSSSTQKVFQNIFNTNNNSPNKYKTPPSEFFNTKAYDIKASLFNPQIISKVVTFIYTNKSRNFLNEYCTQELNK